MESTSYAKIPASVKSTLGDSDWNLTANGGSTGTGNTTADGVITFADNGYHFFSGISNSTLYKVQYTVVTATTTYAGAMTFAGGSSAFGAMDLDSSVGTHTYYLVSIDTTLSLRSVGFRGTITDYTAKPVTNDLVGYWALDEVVGLKIAPDSLDDTSLGSEIVTNGDLSNGTTGWYDDNNATFEVASGELHAVTSGSAFDGVRYSLGTNVTSGKFYKIQFDYRVVGSSMFFYIFSDDTGTSSACDSNSTATTTLASTSTTTVTIYWECTQNNARLSWVNGGSASREIYIDNLSVKEFGANGNHGVLL